MDKPALVLRTCAPPHDATYAVADGCVRAGIDLLVVVDRVEAGTFDLPGARIFHLEQATAHSDLLYAGVAVHGHPSTRNLGYLEALRTGRPWLAELDEGGFPLAGFFAPRRQEDHVPQIRRAGWINVCKYFSTEAIWLRGLPLEFIQEVPPAFRALPVGHSHCPIQQGLTEGHPDTDAVFRLVHTPPSQLHHERRLALEERTWSPLNGCNTTWWGEAFPLLYLPATCPGRLADIWRGLIAQRIAWANQWSVLVHGPNVRESRRGGDLMDDFAEEVTGYLYNRTIAERLEGLPLEPGPQHLGPNLRHCYEALIALGVLHPRERVLLEAWLLDLGEFGLLPEDPQIGAA